ncbi:hypothetical protein Tco_1460949, partial [Tanacetum coccineum]
MPIELNKPPDPLLEEFCELTKMTSAEEICNASFNDTKVKVMKVKHRKPHRGVKISTPGSAGAGSLLRHLRSAKVAGKARDRAEVSPSDNRGGKRKTSSIKEDVVDKVLYEFKSGALNSNLKFSMGSASDVNPVCSLNNEIDANTFYHGNDGSFINIPLDKSPCSDKQSIPVAESCGLKTSFDHTS